MLTRIAREAAGSLVGAVLGRLRAGSTDLPRLPARAHTGRLRVHARGDWNDQLFTKMAEGKRRSPYYLEIRNSIGQLVRVIECATREEAKDRIRGLNPERMFRLVTRDYMLISWDTRNKA